MQQEEAALLDGQIEINFEISLHIKVGGFGEDSGVGGERLPWRDWIWLQNWV